MFRCLQNEHPKFAVKIFTHSCILTF